MNRDLYARENCNNNSIVPSDSFLYYFSSLLFNKISGKFTKNERMRMKINFLFILNFSLVYLFGTSAGSILIF